MAKIKLPDNYEVFTFDGNIKGKLVFPVEVKFNCSDEELVEHFVAKGYTELVPLVGGDDTNFNPVTCERVEEVLATEEQARVELENKTVAQLKDFANEFDIDLGEAKKKAEIIDVILANLGTKEKVEGIEAESPKE